MILRRCPQCAYVACGVDDMEMHAEKRGREHAQGNWVLVPGQERYARPRTSRLLLGRPQRAVS